MDVRPDGSVDAQTPEYVYTGGPITNASWGFFGCEGLPREARPVPRSPGCHSEYVNVQVPDGRALLRVDISSVEDPLCSASTPPSRCDFDLYVRDPYGELVGRSVGGGPEPETLTTQVDESGIYTILVVVFNGIEATYDGTVTLLPEDA